MTQSLKMPSKTSQRPLFLRERGFLGPKKGGKPPKIPGAVAYRGNLFQKKFTGKERDPETGLYYYGARYLDPKTSRWLSGDPALGEYIPSAPVNDEARKRNESLPGMGGVFNTVNMHAYHYAGNNPVKYTDPDGRNDLLSRDVDGSTAIVYRGGGGGATAAALGCMALGFAIGVASTSARNRDPFPDARHIPVGNRPQSPMGKGANSGPMELPEGPNLNGKEPNGKVIKKFVIFALGALAQIYDNITGNSASPPPEPSEKKPVNKNPPSPSTPSFLPHYPYMKPPEEAPKAPSQNTE